MLIWNDSCSIGMDIIDAQHKHLFEIGNKAYALLKNGLQTDKYDDIGLIVEDLRNYTKYHFKCEEDYMIKIKYPGYEEQKKEHDNFVKELDKINMYNDDEDHQKYIEDLLHFVFAWILDHIVEKDKLIKPL
ncbi:bacteriohemerythrin [Clostridium sp.]|jgi:hemerythrin|uniref:bacteriohemerythrin n=1 Tax=Clostridium sp. TaxID=1506 RepID=UPI003EED2DB4